MSADKISAVSAHKTSVVSQDISILSTTQGRSPCVVDTIEISWETTDVLCADTTDILSADTTDVLSAETQQMSCLQTHDDAGGSGVMLLIHDDAARGVMLLIHNDA